ncbi:MAG: hypothetical protein JWM98_3104 [Thermoleophilia bacterium]|nr:hypothetical protein [Thermoleophilia bacterium]
MSSSVRATTLVSVLVAGALLVGGCGSSNDSGKSDSKKSAAADTTIKVTADEMSLTPATFTTKAGKVKFTLKNAGSIEHELVVLKTDAAPDSLKPDAKGKVPEGDSVGEVSETKAGATRSTVLDLKAGSYVLVCNISGHYGAGMRGTLKVT